jgi:hypothetical protein
MTVTIFRIKIDPLSELILTLLFSTICSLGQESSREDDLCHSIELAERSFSKTHRKVAEEPTSVVTSAIPNEGIDSDWTWTWQMRNGSREKKSSFSVVSVGQPVEIQRILIN